MTVEFICPNCNVEQKTVWSPDASLSCEKCHTTLSHFTSGKTDSIERCGACGHDQFYLQKDFNPRIGLFIFVVGVAFSYHTHFISLFVATAIDFILYYAIATVTICYQCRAIYRGFKENPAHQGYNHMHALKYIPKSNAK